MTVIGPASCGVTFVSAPSCPNPPGPEAFAQTLRTLLQRADQAELQTQAATGDAAMFNEHGFFTPPERVDVTATDAPASVTPIPLLPAIKEGQRREPVIGEIVSATSSSDVPLRTDRSMPTRSPTAPPDTVAQPDSEPSVAFGTSMRVASSELAEQVRRPHRAAAAPSRWPLVSVAILAGEQGATVSLRTPTLGDEDREALHGAVTALLARHGIALGALRINGQASNTGRGG